MISPSDSDADLIVAKSAITYLNEVARERVSVCYLASIEAQQMSNRFVFPLRGGARKGFVSLGPVVAGTVEAGDCVWSEK